MGCRRGPGGPMKSVRLTPSLDSEAVMTREWRKTDVNTDLGVRELAPALGFPIYLSGSLLPPWIAMQRT